MERNGTGINQGKIRLLHISPTLRPGDHPEADHEKHYALCDPFIRALEYSKDCFYGMVLNGKYLYEVLARSRMQGWANYAKWATEAAFEFVRKTEFPRHISRLNSCFYYENIEDCQKLFRYDWGSATEEERAGVKLLEVELDDQNPARYDMLLYDEAFEQMRKGQNVDFVLSRARDYFSGNQTEHPLWEIISASYGTVIREFPDAWKESNGACFHDA